jgi:hypothetical protein
VTIRCRRILVQPLFASIDVHASVGDALRAFSELDVLAPGAQVDFEPLGGPAASRVTVRLAHDSTPATLRALERRLFVLKSWAERREFHGSR